MDSQDERPLRADIVITAGASWTDVFYFVGSDNLPALVAGCTARWRAWDPHTNTLLLDFTTAGGKLVIDTDAGSVAFAALPADTADLADRDVDARVLKHELAITWPSTESFVYVAGNATIYVGAPS